MLKLYGLTQSRALRCLWMLYEIDEPFELVRVYPDSPDFPEQINPNRKIPALVDGPTVMWESMAINLYLAQTRTTELSPRGRAELGDALKWTLWAQSELEEFFNKTGITGRGFHPSGHERHLAYWKRPYKGAPT